jgi:hypothetical protein
MVVMHFGYGTEIAPYLFEKQKKSISKNQQRVEQANILDCNWIFYISFGFLTVF